MGPDNILGLLLYTFSPILTAIISFFVGFVIMKGLRIQMPEHAAGFFTIFTGFLSINTLTSIVVTGGVSVQIFILFLAVALIWELKRHQYIFCSKSDSSVAILPNLKLIVLLHFIWGVIFTFAFYFHLSNPEIVRSFYPDNYFYALTSDYILESGQENHYGNINSYPGFKGGTCPYHYFMIYENLIHKNLWGLNTIWSFIISVPILFAALSSLLIISIIKDVQPHFKNQYLVIGFGVLALYFSGFNIMPFSYPEKGNFTLQIVNHVSPKYLPLFICMLLTSWALYKEKYHLFIYPMILMVLFSFMVLPVSLWTIPIGLFLAFLFKKISGKDFLIHLVISMVFFAGLIVFYAMTEVKDEADPLAVSYSAVLKSFFADPIFVIKRIIGTHVYYTMEYVIYFVPLFILLIINRKQFIAKKELILFIPVLIYILIMFEGATTATWLLHEHAEGFQVMFFTVTIGSTLMLMWMVLFSLQSQIKNFIVLVGIIICIGFWNLKNHIFNNHCYMDTRFETHHVSKKFYNECASLFQNDKPHHIAMISKVGIVELYSMMRFLYQMNSDIRLYCIEEKEKKDLGQYKQHWNNLFYFYQYIKGKDQSNLAQLQEDFIKEKGIQYLIVDKFSKEDDYWIKNSTLVFKDDRTKLALYKINR